MKKIMQKSMIESSRQFEWRVGTERQENETLYKKLEESKSTIKDLENKIAITTLEVSKKTGKVNQIITSYHILQSHVENMRQEAEQERLSVSREVSHLNAIISEKNSIIERLKAEGNHEADKQVFEVGLTLQTIDVSENIFDGLFDASFDPNLILFDSFTKDDSKRTSPRTELVSKSGIVAIETYIMDFTKKSSNPVDITDAPDTYATNKPPPRKMTQEIGIQKDLDDLQGKLSKSTPAESQALPVSSKAAAISKADAEHIAAVDLELKETIKSMQYYKGLVTEKEKKIDQTHLIMREQADQNSKIINELSLELDRVTSLLRRQVSE